MNSIVFVSILALVAVASAHPEWEKFKSLHGKKYDSPLEESLRKTIFLQNKQMIEDFNANKAKEAGYEMGLNHLSDRSSDEMNHRNGFRMPKEPIENTIEAQEFFNKLVSSFSDDLPEAVDWRKSEGRVTEVKDQGHCGSCWTFAATGALEGQMKVQNKTMVALSEQNLIDCSDGFTFGCDGGNMYRAFEYVHKENGIEDESDYPYLGRQQKACHYDKSKSKFNDKGGYILTKVDEQLLKKTVANFGPVSVAIYAGLYGFFTYKSGVFYDERCSPALLNHAVLVVGYGVEKGQDYWLVKNSWGKFWGDNGYIKMARNRNNHCGIASRPTIPTF